MNRFWLTKAYIFSHGSSYVFIVCNFRDDLTSNLPVLEYRHSSDDEVLSVDDMDSTGTYETADEMDDEPSGSVETPGAYLVVISWY